MRASLPPPCRYWPIEWIASPASSPRSFRLAKHPPKRGTCAGSIIEKSIFGRCAGSFSGGCAVSQSSRPLGSLWLQASSAWVRAYPCASCGSVFTQSMVLTGSRRTRALTQIPLRGIDSALGNEVGILREALLHPAQTGRRPCWSRRYLNSPTSARSRRCGSNCESISSISAGSSLRGRLKAIAGKLVPLRRVFFRQRNRECRPRVGSLETFHIAAKSLLSVGRPAQCVQPFPRLLRIPRRGFAEAARARRCRAASSVRASHEPDTSIPARGAPATL